MTNSKKDVTNKKFLGCVEISSKIGFRILLTQKVKNSTFDVDDATKLFFIKAIINNIEANLMIDLGLAEIGDDSGE